MNATLTALSTEEIRQFITHGFLIKRKVLEPELCARARDRLWAGNTSNHLRRDDPQTWINGIPEEERTSTPDGMNDRTGNYGWRLRELSGDEDLINLLPRRVFPWFEQLLGEGAWHVPSGECCGAYRDLPEESTSGKGLTHVGLLKGTIFD